MAKITINLPGGLQVEREVLDKPAPKSSGRPLSLAFAPTPFLRRNLRRRSLEKAAEVVEEAVKPKTRRGRPKKKPADSE